MLEQGVLTRTQADNLLANLEPAPPAPPERRRISRYWLGLAALLAILLLMAGFLLFSSAGGVAEGPQRVADTMNLEGSTGALN